MNPEVFELLSCVSQLSHKGSNGSNGFKPFKTLRFTVSVAVVMAVTMSYPAFNISSFYY